MTKTEINTLYIMIHEERRSLQRRWRMTPSGPALLECQEIGDHLNTELERLACLYRGLPWPAEITT